MVFGLLGLSLAAAAVVWGAKHLAQTFGVSHAAMGTVVAAVGTSIPEIATNLGAAVSSLRGEDASGIAVGNILGSCISQVTLLLGITAILSPIRATRRRVVRDGGMALAAIGLMFLACRGGQISRWEAGALVAAYVAYLAWVWRDERTDSASDEPTDGPPTWLAVFACLVGIVGLAISADAIIDGAVHIAQSQGVPRKTLGVGVGVATGLPELAVAVQAVRSNVSQMALGNLLGSNVTDPLATFGLGALVSPVAVTESSLDPHFMVWAAATFLALGLLSVRPGLTRVRGGVLVVGFAGYATALILPFT